jgi:DNA-binding MarR family transcriptional regulator
MLEYNKHSYYNDDMSDDLGYLISDTARLLRRSFDERARVKSITRPQWRVLALLNRFAGSSQITLSDMLDVEPITLARMIDRLQEAGLVQRRADPADRRAWKLYLTQQGENKYAELKPLAVDLFSEALLGLSEHQQTDLENMLNIIRTNLTRRAPAVANG